MSYAIEIYVLPNSSKNEVVGKYNQMLKIKIKAPAENSKANNALKKVLSEYLGVKEGDVSILKGLLSRHKTVLISSSLHNDMTL